MTLSSLYSLILRRPAAGRASKDGGRRRDGCKSFEAFASRRRLRMRYGLAALLSALLALSAHAVEPDEVLDDPALEARATEISRNLRCVVCQSQSIDDSNAPLAKDMRLIVRERLVAGDSDAEVYAFLVDRYGDYVLLKPPVQQNTVLLWASPLVILLLAGVSAAFFLRRMKSMDDADETNDAAPGS